MKFFIDTANIADIKRINGWGVLDEVTTNPSLIAKESGMPFEAIIEKICGIVNGPISAEVIALDAPTIIKEGRLLAKIHPDVGVKVPLTAEGLKATHAFHGCWLGLAGRVSAGSHFEVSGSSFLPDQALLG